MTAVRRAVLGAALLPRQGQALVVKVPVHEQAHEQLQEMGEAPELRGECLFQSALGIETLAP